MNKTLSASAILLALGLAACSEAPVTPSAASADKAVAQTQQAQDALTQAQLQQLGDSLVVTYRVVTNVPDDKCLKDKADGRCFVAQIDFVPGMDLASQDWEIYLSQMRPVQSVESGELTITHVKGDLHRITPTAAFKGFVKGEKKQLTFRGEPWQLAETDAMPNYYLAAKGLEPVIIASTQVGKDAETGLETRPYVEGFTNFKTQYQRTETDKLAPADAAQLFKANQSVSEDAALAVDTIIPTPQKVKIHSTDTPVK